MAEYTTTGDLSDPDCRYSIPAEAWQELDDIIEDWLIENMQVRDDSVQMESWSMLAVNAIREHVVGEGQ